MHIDEKGPGFTQMQNYEKIIYEIVIISCIAVISKKYQFTLLIIWNVAREETPFETICSEIKDFQKLESITRS